MGSLGRGPEYTELRPRRIHDLVKILNENAIDLGQTVAPRGLSAGVQSLYEVLQSRVMCLVLRPQGSHASSSSNDGAEDGESELCLMSQRVYLHWQLGSKLQHTLVNTHSRDKVSAKRVPPLPLFQRLVEQPYEEMVAQFMARFLDLPLENISGNVNVTRVDYETDYTKPSETFPGLPTIFAFYSAYFSLSLPLPLNFGRPLVRTQKVPNEGVEEMWSWRPYHLCPNPQRTVSTDLSIYEMHPKYEDIQDLLERSLHIEAGALLRVLRAPYDGQQPVVLLVAAHREALNTTQLVVAKVVWDTTDEEVGEHSRAGAELRQATRCAQRAAGGVGSLAKQAGGSGNYFYDQSKRMALIALELKGSCLELAELQQAILSRNIQAPVVLLSEVLQTSFHRGELGGIHGALAPRMEGIIAQLAGPGGAVAQLMNLQRGSLDLLEAYHLENLPSIADPKGPRHNSHSIFHPLMGGMIDNLCRTCGLGDFRGQLLERLVDIQKVCQQLASKTWRKEAWRPLCHLAHGNLSPSSVLVDGNGETWLYNWGTYSQQVSWQRGKAKCGGVQPFFRDLARLSARLLLEGCVLPFSLRQAQIICTAQWVEIPDISRWLDIPPFVAYMFQRKMQEAEFTSERAQPATKAQGTRRVSKIIEASVPGSGLMVDNLQGRLVGRGEDARQCFQRMQRWHQELLQLPLLQLKPEEPQPPPEAAEPEEEEGDSFESSRHTAWRQQRALHEAAAQTRQLAYERFLHDPAWLVKSNSAEGDPAALSLATRSALQPVDFSPLLFGLPFLEELLDLLVAPGLDPWQKAWGCSLAIELATRLLPLLSGIAGRLPPDISEQDSDDDDDALLGVDVRFGVGHRLCSCSGGITFGPSGKSLDGMVGFRAGLTPELLDKALIGWPCPILGVQQDMVEEHRRNLGKLPCGEMDFQTDQLLESLPHFRRASLWRKSACGLYEVLGLDVKPEASKVKERSFTRSLTLSSRQMKRKLTRKLSKEAISTVKMLEVITVPDGSELNMLGHRIGLASYLPGVKQCEGHSKPLRMLMKDAYDVFPCSSCKQCISVREKKLFGFCEECWDADERFTLCPDCLHAEKDFCGRGHRLELLSTSPYDGTPCCGRCGTHITWPWHMAPGDGQSPNEPLWFHCSRCPMDLCAACSYRQCPQQHLMQRLAAVRDGPSSCRGCGKGGRLLLYHCGACQEARCEVVYPSGAAALADIRFSEKKPGDFKVASAQPNGPASLAGVQPGQRLLVNDEILPSLAALEDMGTVLVEFSAAQIEVTFDSAKDVRESLRLQRSPDGEPRLYVTEVRKWHARQEGVELGCRLLTINGRDALQLAGRVDALESLESEKPPYVLRFQQSGPRLLCHAGCCVACDESHDMSAQFGGGVLCEEGHILKCMPCAELPLDSRECESCGEALETLALACEQCIKGIDTEPEAMPPRSATLGTQMTQMSFPTQERFKLLCFRCGRRRCVDACTESPYKSQGAVQCQDCGEEVGQEGDERLFHHCRLCWHEGIKHDRCYSCAIQRMQCAKCHPLQAKADAFVEPSCLICCRSLKREAFHCRDCWWSGQRSDRCEACSSQTQVQYCIDNNARLQVVPGDAPEIWNGPFQPKLLCALQASDDAEIELEVTLKLRGFIYPLGARIALPALFNCREATIMQLHETGKYALRFDGGQEKVLYEPDLTNHVPAGVWRYGAGQKLMVFIEGKWRDVRVHKLGVGSSHILESSKKRRWEVDLNSYNHSPAWLGDEWWWQMRQWEDMLLCRIGATDALSGQPAEILSLHWSLVQQHLSENQGKTIFDGLSGDYDTGQPWSMLLQLAQRAAGRSMGRPPARKPVLLLGSVGSGKTRLLRRLASEALHAHEGEMVPLLVNALQLLIGTSISTRVSNENCQQKSFMRPSVKDSEKMALRRLASLDFLAIYIRMAYGCSATGRFLRQAAHARRLLLLVDGLELCPKDLQKPLLEGLARLSAVGHRVVVAASPPAHLFGHLRPVEKVEAEEEVNDADGEAVIVIGGRSSSGKIPAGNKNPAENLPKEDPEPYWCSAFNQVRQIWLCPLTPSQLRTRAQMRLGHLGDAPERVLEQLKEARLLQVLARSAPFFELALSHMERLLAKDAPSRPSRSQRSTPSDGADEPDRVSLPPLKPPAQAQPAASSVGTCALLGELVAAACRLLMQSLQDVKMQRRGRQRGVDSNAGDHLQMALQFLALKALETSSDRLDEEEATAVIEFAGSSALMATWRELQELRDEDFWLLRRCECWHSWDRHVVYYSFPCPCIQSYLASLEVAASWGKTGCLHCLEEVFEESRWQQLLPFLAELLPGPLTLEFASLPEHQAQLMAEFFSRQPAVVRLDLAGCQLGMNRSTLRFVAAALRDDQSLRHLDLSDNALGSEGVHSLCQALAQHPSLKELKLGKNHIGQVGAVKVVDLLRVNHRILRVDLEDNPIGSEWANYIYILQRDRTATLQSARRQNRMGAVPKLENIEAAPETERPERITSMSSRLRREDPQEEKVRSARTPRLVA